MQPLQKGQLIALAHIATLSSMSFQRPTTVEGYDVGVLRSLIVERMRRALVLAFKCIRGHDMSILGSSV